MYQQRLFSDYSSAVDKLSFSDNTGSARVECLGRVFSSERERRIYFLSVLQERLEELHEVLGGVPFTTVDDAIMRLRSLTKWPIGDDSRLYELVKRMANCADDKDLLQRYKDVVGFPHGEIENILEFSDPPYYTACPNPFINEFIEYYGKHYDPDADDYHCDGFGNDLIVSRNDIIYKACRYHTKIPYKAIVPLILHYTKPGDIVFDGFCGSGMTGVAAQWCGIAPDDYRHEIEDLWKQNGKGKPDWGMRYAVLSDLSPHATFVSSNYNLSIDLDNFLSTMRRILDDVLNEIGWMYETYHVDGRTKGIIDYVVWSEVFLCPHCSNDVIFLDHALDPETNTIKREFSCHACNAVLDKKSLVPCFESYIDQVSGEYAKKRKFIPMFIQYRIGEQKFQKKLDDYDLEVLRKIDKLPFPNNIPTNPFPIDRMYYGTRLWAKGICNIHHLFLPRCIHVLSAIKRRLQECDDRRIRNMVFSCFEYAVDSLSLQNLYGPNGYSQSNSRMPSTYYIPSQIAEVSLVYIFRHKLERLEKAFKKLSVKNGYSLISTESLTYLHLADNSIDYIFTDPPFGENIIYSELNFLKEAWYGVFTNDTMEAIIDRCKAKYKDLQKYQYLLQRCFEEYYRVLKPGRWMTLVFHNVNCKFWNVFHSAILASGFVVKDVCTLDKGQLSYNQVKNAGVVKRNLILSCYKSKDGIRVRRELIKSDESSVWDFVEQRLKDLPVFARDNDSEGLMIEREPHALFDRMVSFFILNGMEIPISAAEFYKKLAKRFSEKDGLYFLSEQLIEYENICKHMGNKKQINMFR